ncbi:hypothetical protein N431DRAFT_177807 [Stipitochalara longipes BDJ]|nr:hypothetical protein N431DRAFT_177807 [Stipitochalara longipes BDJ]
MLSRIVLIKNASAVLRAWMAASFLPVAVARSPTCNIRSAVNILSFMPVWQETTLSYELADIRTGIQLHVSSMSLSQFVIVGSIGCSKDGPIDCCRSLSASSVTDAVFLDGDEWSGCSAIAGINSMLLCPFNGFYGEWINLDGSEARLLGQKLVDVHHVRDR